VYLAQSIEPVTRSHAGGRQSGFRLMVWRVALSPQGRPVWRVQRDVGTWWSWSDAELHVTRARQNARAAGAKTIPFMQDAGPGKFVTPRQAERLTGLHMPAAMDALTEQVQEKVAEWDAAIQHAVEKRREWRKKVRYRERRAAQLAAPPEPSSPNVE
jgi:hypothetical protein